jgi:hypothetical protein
VERTTNPASLDKVKVTNLRRNPRRIDLNDAQSKLN